MEMVTNTFNARTHLSSGDYPGYVLEQRLSVIDLREPPLRSEPRSSTRLVATVLRSSLTQYPPPSPG